MGDCLGSGDFNGVGRQEYPCPSDADAGEEEKKEGELDLADEEEEDGADGEEEVGPGGEVGCAKHRPYQRDRDGRVGQCCGGELVAAASGTGTGDLHCPSDDVSHADGSECGSEAHSMVDHDAEEEHVEEA